MRARYYCGGRLVISGLTALDLAACETVEEDLDGLAGQLRDVDGVDVALLLRETGDGEVRGNLRSSERFDVSAYARTLGGGGHRAASGFTLMQTDLNCAWERCAREIADRLTFPCVCPTASMASSPALDESGIAEKIIGYIENNV